MGTIFKTVKPGDLPPDDPRVAAATAMTRTFLWIADEIITRETGLDSQGAIAAAMSGLTSAAVNVASRYNVSGDLAENLLTIAAQLRPPVPGLSPAMHCAQIFFDLVNALQQLHGIEETVSGLLNAAANVGAVRGEHAEMARMMREFADMLTDPEKIEAAKARAKLAFLPIDTPVQ